MEVEQAACRLTFPERLIVVELHICTAWQQPRLRALSHIGQLLGEGPENLAFIQASGIDPVVSLLQLQPGILEQMLGEMNLLVICQMVWTWEMHHLHAVLGEGRVFIIVCEQALALGHFHEVGLLPPVVDGDLQIGWDGS